MLLNEVIHLRTDIIAMSIGNTWRFCLEGISSQLNKKYGLNFMRKGLDVFG